MRSATLIAGLGWGDEAKGATVDAIARRLPGAIVVRHHGGPQAAHNVWETNKRGHTFSQFGSGTFAGARTHLSRFMFVNPITWRNERTHLVDELKLQLPGTTVEEEAVVITPYHRVMNKLREKARGTAAHGTTGHGVGEAMSDLLDGRPTLRVADLRSQKKRDRILAEIRETKWQQALGLMSDVDPQYFSRIATDSFSFFLEHVQVVDREWLGQQDADLIFEGAQGVLLDQDWGFHPHTTWSNCTFENAEELLVDLDGPVTKIGVLRSYMTRHGAGPFPSEDRTLDIPEHDNSSTGPAGAWRCGDLDLVMLRYAIAVLGGVDFLSLSHLDKLPHLNRYVYAYEASGESIAGLRPAIFPRDLDAREELTRSLFDAKPLYERLLSKRFFVEFIEAELGASVLLTANGRTSADRTWRRPPATPKNSLMISPYAARWTTEVRAPILNR